MLVLSAHGSVEAVQPSQGACSSVMVKTTMTRRAGKLTVGRVVKKLQFRN